MKRYIGLIALLVAGSSGFAATPASQPPSGDSVAKEPLVAVADSQGSQAQQAPDDPNAAPTQTPPPDANDATDRNVVAQEEPTVVTSGEATKSDIIHTVDDAKDLTGFYFSADLDHWLGTGTFVNSSYYPYLAGAVTIGPRYTFKIKNISLAATLTWRFIYEYTPPANETGRRASPGDIRLGLSAPVLFREKVTGIGLTPSIGLSAPTSLESWQSGLITNASIGVSLSRSVSRFDFSVSGGGSHGFYSGYQNLVHAPSTPETVSGSNVTVLCRTGETVCNTLGMNTDWSASVGANINFRATSALIFYVGYTYIHSWKYGVGSSQYDAETLDSNGNKIVVDAGQADRTFGSFGASYDLSDHYSLGLSATTLQTPRTMGANGAAGGFKFPFWSTTPADNNTTINFTLSAAY